MVSVPPTLRVMEVLSRVMPVTSESPGVGGSGGVSLAVTVTVTVALNPPSLVVTVMVAVPGLTAVTRPDSSTVATLVSLEEKVTSLTDASEGSTA